MVDDQSTRNTPITAKWIVRRMLRRQRKYVLLSAVFCVIDVGMLALVTVVIGLIVDHAVIAGDLARLVIGLLSLVVLMSVSNFVWSSVIRVTTLACQNEVYSLRQEIVRRALDPQGERNARKAGDSLSVAISDANKATEFARLSGMFVGLTAKLCILFIILLIMNVWLGIGSLLGSLCISGVLHGLTAVKLSRHHLECQIANAHTAALATDLIAGIRTLRGIGGADTASFRYRLSSEKALFATFKLTKISACYESAIVILSGTFLAVVVGFSAWLTLTGVLTIGELITAVAVASSLSSSVRGLGSYGQAFAGGWGAAVRVAAALNTSPIVNVGPSEMKPLLMNEQNPLTFENVSYQSLTNINVSLYPGEMLGIFSFDPTETDMFLTLLAHEVPKTEYCGKIFINGIPADELSIDAIRQTILVEQHNTVLFEGSIRTNLFSTKEKGSDEYAVRALAATAATDIVSNNPAGLDQKVFDRGITLSGGQRQRIGLARALCANAPILVLAEPTTAIDAATEEIVADGLIDFRHTNTESSAGSTIVFTSSPILLSRAHRVIVVDDGKITESGTHADLIERNFRYRQAVLR